MLQDECQELSRWLATRPGARRQAKDAAMSIEQDEDAPRRDGPKPVTTVAELQTLSEESMVRGYRAGLGNSANFTERERSYWHGYLNGLVDGGHAKISPEQAELARAVVASRKTPND